MFAHRYYVFANYWYNQEFYETNSKKWTLIALKSHIEFVHFFKANLITLLGVSAVCKCIIFMDKHNVKDESTIPTLNPKK